MWSAKITSVLATLVIATCGATIASYDARARSNVKGEYNCGCKDGEGRCVAYSDGEQIHCVNSSDKNACTGKCVMSIIQTGVTGKAGAGTTTKVQPEGAETPIAPIAPKVVPKANIQAE